MGACTPDITSLKRLRQKDDLLPRLACGGKTRVEADDEKERCGFPNELRGGGTLQMGRVL